MSEPGSSSTTVSAGESASGTSSAESASAPAGSDDPLSPRPEPTSDSQPARESSAREPAARDSPAREAADELAVDLILETDDTDPPLTPWLGDQLVRLAGLAGVSAGSISLVVVDDARMAALHGQYYGDGSTTDVLSFDMRDAPDAPDSPIEGDLVLCLDEAQRQATQRNHAVRMELLLYALHGLLHLLGHDDHDENEAQRMHQREDELLMRAGFDAVYGSG